MMTSPSAPQTAPQSPVSATAPFSVTLEAQQWNGVLGALSEAPYRIAAPLIQTISEQLQQQSAPQGPPNGLDHRPPERVPS